MCPLTREQRPPAADARPVERATVGVFAVSVTLIAMPHRTARRLRLESGIDHFDRIDDSGIIRSAQPETHERKRIEADHQRSRCGRVLGGPVLDRYEPVTR